jgi:hypothetical protein
MTLSVGIELPIPNKLGGFVGPQRCSGNGGTHKFLFPTKNRTKIREAATYTRKIFVLQNKYTRTQI